MKLDDYVDVAERIRQFKEQFPEGSLQSGRDPFTMEIGDRTFIVYCALAVRGPDDKVPGVGWAWEPVPGPTPFTKDSELMNAETSAWGRAIVALGFETKKIASANEVRNRQSSEGGDARAEADALPESHAPPSEGFQAPPAATEKAASAGVLGMLKQVVETLQKGFPKSDPEHKYWDDVQTFMYEKFGKQKSSELTEDEAQQLVLEFEKRLITEQNVKDAPFSEEAA